VVEDGLEGLTQHHKHRHIVFDVPAVCTNLQENQNGTASLPNQTKDVKGVSLFASLLHSIDLERSNPVI
jgi:hypothetical protein